MKTIAPTSPQKGTPLIVRLLAGTHQIDRNTINTLRDVQLRENTTFEELLIRRKIASENDIAEAYANHYLIPLFDPPLDSIEVDPALCNLLPEKLCRDHIVAAVSLSRGTLDVAFFTPHELFLVDELELLTGHNVRPLFAPLSVIEHALAGLYEDSQWSLSSSSGSQAAFEEVQESIDGEPAGEEAAEAIIHLDQPPPPGRDGRIIRYVNQIFEQALRSRASDVHIEPFEGYCRVRLRVDGRLNEIPPPPVWMYAPIVSRIKVLARMDIAEKRVPQDGAIALRSEERRVDMRVSTCPTVNGEKVVLRVLDKDAIPLSLAGLGLDERQERDLSGAIEVPHGLMLVTGPTGSGKSTTLYACLNHLNQGDVNICTVEDPVEYKFTGINQVQTKAQVGLSFANTLRSFLRQDPDIIMVGEVRDSETAQICLRAALTGHFVLSTLHTNDALSAVSRLIDMDIEPFLLASTLRALVAQRLIRRLCGDCREPYTLDDLSQQRFAVPREATVYRPIGCQNCRETGYRGRIGVFEVIRITRSLSELVQAGRPLSELRELVSTHGVQALSSNAMKKVREGQTSLEEALSTSISEEF